MKTRIIIAVALMLTICSGLATRVTDLPLVGGVSPTNIIMVATNENISTFRSAQIPLGDFLDSLITFPNWPIGGGGGGGPGSFPANANQLSTNGILTIKDSAALTNANLRAPVLLSAAAGDRVAVIDGDMVLTNASNVDTTELNYVDGATNNIQSQINALRFSPNTLKIFVETNGNDATAIPGNPTRPFLSIKSAFSNVVNNAAVIVGPGRFSYTPTVQTNGTTGIPITTPTWFENVTNVALIGSGPSTVFESGTSYGEFMCIREADNVFIKDFTLMNTNVSGPEIGTLGITNLNWSSIRPEGTNGFIGISGVKFLNHTHQAVDHLFGPIRTTKLVVDGCWFESIGVTNVPGAVTHDGAAFVGVGTGWEMRNCVVTNCFRGVELIHTRTPSDTVQHSGVKIINTKFLGIWENAITTLSPYKDVLIENCLITRLSPTTETEGYAMKIAGGGSEFTIRGNTIVGWNHAIYSETSETNMVIEANRFINNGVGITLYVASGDGRKSTGHIVRNNFFQDISGPAIQIGGVNNAIIGNQFLNCKTNTTAGQGVIRMVNPTTNLVIRGNWYRSFQSIDTNAFCISLVGANHQIQDEIFQDYKTSIYTGTAVGTTFGFHNHKQNAALTPTDGDVWTYVSALNTWTNQPSGSSGEVNVLGDSSVTNATTISLAGIKSGSTLNLKTVRAGSGIVVTNEGTNVVIASTGGAATTNFVVTTTDHAFVTNLNIVGSSKGFVSLYNTAGDAFTRLEMSDAGISTTQAYSFSAITPGQVLAFHDENGTVTNVTASAGGSTNVQMISAGYGLFGNGSYSNNVYSGGGYFDTVVVTNTLSFQSGGGIFDDPGNFWDINTNDVPDAVPTRSVVTNIVNALSGPTPSEYTVPITGTNFIIDWSALGKTNSLVLTNYAAAGILNTNVISGNKLTIKIIQGSQGFQTIVPNTNYFGPNWRYTAVQTGITQSTNGGYEDFIVLYGSRTNAVLSGQNWGAAP